MSGLLHGPNAGSDQPEDPVIQTRNSKLGLKLFSIYAAIYAAYVIVGAFLPGVMKTRLAGLNVAVLWGFLLILLAFVMAIVYGRMCARPANTNNEGGNR